MVRLIPSHVFVKDPVGVWGEEQTIGLAELAVRTHAPPMTFDRRGDIMFGDAFESATPSYEDASSGTGTIARSINTSRTGEFSLKCTTGVTTTDWAGIAYETSDFHLGKIGFQGVFSTASSNIYLYVVIKYYDGTNWNVHGIRWDSDGIIYVLDKTPGGPFVWTQVSTNAKYQKAIQNFGTVKLVGDIENDSHIRALLFGTEYDLTSYPCRTGPVADTEKWVRFEIYFSLKSNGTAETCYIDNVIATENEPA